MRPSSTVPIGAVVLAVLAFALNLAVWIHEPLQTALFGQPLQTAFAGQPF